MNMTPRCRLPRTAMALLVVVTALAAALCAAHDDYLPLAQPQLLESPCVQRWNAMAAHFATARGATRPLVRETQPSELHVNLTVQVGRYVSRYVDFNTRTYNGRIPAPTIKVCPGDKLVVHVRNALRDGGANLTNLHVHGMHVSPAGHHDNVLKSIAPGGERRYEYEIRPDHPPGTFWYHPHSHGLVNTQLSGLMAGALIVADRPGDFPEEIATMQDHVLILQGVCVEKCHTIYDSLVHALQNDYGEGDAMMMMDMNMTGDARMTKTTKEKKNDTMSMADGTEMAMGDMDMDGEGDSEEEEEEDEDEFPINLRVNKSSPLNDTSLLHVYVNGQYLPELHMTPGEFKRLRYINAIPNNVAELVAPGCEMHILSRDGIYIKSPSKKDVVVLPPGSRADVGIRCNQTGTFFLETEASPKRNQLLGMANRHRVPSQRIVSLRVFGDDPLTMALPTQLPKPPAYMDDTMALGGKIESENKYNYEFSVWMDGANMQYGVNKRAFHHEYVNHSMYIDEPQEWELSVRGYGHECEDINHDDMDHRSNLDFSMNKMLDEEQKYQASKATQAPSPSSSAHHSHCHAMTHPFHMHGSHFQITRVDNALDPDGLLYALGEWRDTIPLYRSHTQIRFTPRSHMVGRILTHCHFAAHSDNGMAQLVQVHKSRRR